jgi:hypothetical protein
MLTKSWIAILLGLLLGSMFFSTGCGWFGGGYDNNPYYNGSCNCGAAPAGVPAGTVPTASGAGGWRTAPATGGTAGPVTGP